MAPTLQFHKSKGRTYFLTIDLAIAFAGVEVRLENKNLVFLGTSSEKGYDPLPFATGTWDLWVQA
jgi:hypothetical protein